MLLGFVEGKNYKRGKNVAISCNLRANTGLEVKHLELLIHGQLNLHFQRLGFGISDYGIITLMTSYDTNNFIFPEKSFNYMFFEHNTDQLLQCLRFIGKI